MILKRFYEERLAQASFLLGCPDTHAAIVIDPHRDVELYINAARAEGLRITAVTETHIHADFVSGSRELARRTGTTLAVSGEGGPDWQYAFAGEPGVQLLGDGDVIRAGRVCLTAKHTPGHTPEHLTFVLTDEASSPEPVGAFTGDFIFAGEVGRPDLLERAAGIAGSMETGARQLFRSLENFSDLPDRLLLWPGHGAGSACGKSLGGMPVTTLGYEKLANWAFQVGDETEFVKKVLEDQPDPPRYFAEMKRVNKAGAGPGSTTPARLASDELNRELCRRAQVVDLRPAAQFAQAFVPGLISIPLNKSFLQRAGSLLDGAQEICLLGDEKQVHEAAAALSLIGLERIIGWLDSVVLEKRSEALVRMEQIGAEQVLELQNRGSIVLDVRSDAEYRAGHIPGSVHIPLGRLPESAGALPHDAPIIVHCQGGGRSHVAVSLLHRMGFPKVANYAGGFSDYARKDFPVQTGSAAEASEPAVQRR